MANRWLSHLSQFRKQNSHLDARSMMTEARKTYRGGASGASSSSSSGVTAYVSTAGVAANAGLIKGGNHSYSQNSSAASVGGRRSRRLRGGNCHMKNSNPASVGGRRSRRKSRRSRRR
jgi:hypothetical protein